MKMDLDFYITLFEDFLKTKNIKDQKILWKLNSINNLMKKTEGDHNNLFCENCLRLIMNLFNSFQFDNCDIESKSYDYSSSHQREFMIPLLKSEFI